jgi:hypothetical protein
MHGHPTLGVKNAKPRLSSRPGHEIGKLSEDYLRVRNRQMNTKALTAEMILAKQRDELIQKDLVVKQACFLLTAMRQRILQIPHSYARQLLGITDAKLMSGKLREMSISILNDIKNLPQQVTDPHWLETLENDDSLAPFFGRLSNREICPKTADCPAGRWFAVAHG